MKITVLFTFKTFQDISKRFLGSLVLMDLQDDFQVLKTALT